MKVSLPPRPILLPAPVLVIGSYGPEQRPNIMLASWAGIVSSAPPSISVSLREATLSYHNVTQTGAFTVNIPSEKYLKKADYTGMVSGREHDKFKETHLTPVRSKLVNAPIVEEFPYALECKVAKRIDLGSHTMFVGEILSMVADSKVLNLDELPDIEKVRPVMWGSFGSMGYYTVGAKLGAVFSVGSAAMTEVDDERPRSNQ